MVNNASLHFSRVEADACCFRELKQQVYQRLAQLPQSRLNYVRAKAVWLPLIYFSLYFLALQQRSYSAFCLLYLLLGIMLVLLFINLIHEACHCNLFRSKKANARYLLLFDLIGANSYMWQKRHVRLHHNYPNVAGWDSDIEKCAYLKVHPHDGSRQGSAHQRWLILLYPLFITNWFLIRDFKDFFNRRMIVRKLGDPPLAAYCKLFCFKLVFVGYLVGLPLWITPFSWPQVLAAFFLMLFMAGLFALVVLIPPHVNTGNQFPHPGHNLELDQSWFMHQLQTTNDVTAGNWLTKHLLANCNCHLAHHLFPNISYVYAPEITAVIRIFCIEKGLPYKSYPILSTFRKHYELIRRNEMPANIMNEDL